MERAALSPGIRRTAEAAACTGSGFLLSTVSLGGFPQPVAMGLICSSTGWRAVLMALGAIVGYPSFWGPAGAQGIVWAAAAGLLALLVGARQETRDQPLMLPAISCFLTVVAGVVFRLVLRDPVPWLQILLRGAVALAAGMLFTQAARCRDPVTGWLVWGVGVLSLSRIRLGPYLSLGCGAAGLLAVSGPFPAAALAGAALDLAGVTQVPMTAVLCLSYFLRMIPFDRKWQPLAMPGVAYVLVAMTCGIRDLVPLPGLVLGSLAGGLLPPRPQIAHRRGDTGAAQVRMELGAEMLLSVSQRILEAEPPDIDRKAILEKARLRACGGCVLIRTCSQQRNFTEDLLDTHLEADCRKQARLVPELLRAKEQLKLLQADRKRQREYRLALAQQYRFLSSYLRELSDRLPRGAKRTAEEFRMEMAVRSRGREEANGDRCFAFSGPDRRYFVVLCDGMGTGLGAAREGHEAGKLLRQMLLSGFPAEYALTSLNSLLTLENRGGAVTVDLAAIALDTGIVQIYKWGSAPSWVMTRRSAEKIGTATPPPGMGVEPIRMAVEKLSLRRGEVLVLLSDGVDGEVIPHLPGADAEKPPGELAAVILEKGCGEGEDDATAAVIRLRPAGLAQS